MPFKIPLCLFDFYLFPCSFLISLMCMPYGIYLFISISILYLCLIFLWLLLSLFHFFAYICRYGLVCLVCGLYGFGMGRAIDSCCLMYAAGQIIAFGFIFSFPRFFFYLKKDFAGLFRVSCKLRHTAFAAGRISALVIGLEHALK